jgi:hypothetical protein
LLPLRVAGALYRPVALLPTAEALARTLHMAQTQAGRQAGRQKKAGTQAGTQQGGAISYACRGQMLPAGRYKALQTNGPPARSGSTCQDAAYGADTGRQRRMDVL